MVPRVAWADSGPVKIKFSDSQGAREEKKSMHLVSRVQFRAINNLQWSWMPIQTASLYGGGNDNVIVTNDNVIATNDNVIMTCHFSESSTIQGAYFTSRGFAGDKNTKSIRQTDDQ